MVANENIVEFLIEHNDNLNCTDKLRNTPFNCSIL